MLPRSSFHPPEALLTRLTKDSRPVVFLVGSALSMSLQGSPGVSTVAQMLELIRKRVATPSDPSTGAHLEAQRAFRELEAALAKGRDDGERYQIAFEHLKGWDGGAASVNAVIRHAVLGARLPPVGAPLLDADALLQLEGDIEGWYLGPAVKALGLILARHRERFGQLVLTTNFDPLVEIAVRAAGGQAMVVEQLGDWALPSPDTWVTPVAHLHGVWHSDTLHTPRALMTDRGRLRASLAKRYGQVSLVVLGYGGWDDVLMQALADLTNDPRQEADVLWCFYERDPVEITNRYPKVLKLLGKLRERSACYAGVDCHTLLPKLRKKLDREHEIIGRGSLCDAVFDAQRGEHAVEIIGECGMKRSDVLEWVGKQIAALGGKAARFNAKDLGPRPSPEALLRKAGIAAGLEDEVNAELERTRSTPQAQDIVRALRLLHGTWILIDDAEALAVDGHAFDGTFFSELRGKVQAKEIHWISVSQAPLGELFEKRGLVSEFLNHSVKLRAGGLDRKEVDVAVTARLGSRARWALERTGTLPRLVHRVCGAEWGDVDGTLNGLATWAEGICALWWSRDAQEQTRAEREQTLLKTVAKGALAFQDLNSRQQLDADELLKRGLLVETEAGLALNGHVWREYVRERD